MKRESVIVWFRDDLRLADKPASTAAIASGLPVLPVYTSGHRQKSIRGAGRRIALVVTTISTQLRSLEDSLRKLRLD